MTQPLYKIGTKFRMKEPLFGREKAIRTLVRTSPSVRHGCMYLFQIGNDIHNTSGFLTEDDILRLYVPVRTPTEQRVYDILDKLNIPYKSKVPHAQV